MTDTTPTVIELENVWKRYGLPLLPYLKQQTAKLRGQDVLFEEYGPWALRDLNLTIKQGDSLGIIGRNGAGKSTLLKLLAGVSPISHGSLTISGSIFPMIELNAGLNGELSGYENIEILGAIMGLQGDALQDKIPQIVEFSELGERLEDPVRKYSSGMMARLGFSVAINVDADILLLDEVLSVGDVSFQKKCLRRIERILGDGRTTVLFVSHSPYAIDRICDRAIYLNQGEILLDSTTSDVTTAYFQGIVDEQRKNVDPESSIEKQSNEFSINEMLFFNPKTNETVDSINVGDPFTIRIDVDSESSIDRVNVSIRLTDTASTVIASLFKPDQKVQSDGYIECHIPECHLMPGVYYIDCVIKLGTGTPLANIVQGASFTVNLTSEIHNKTGSLGIVHLDADWTFTQQVNEVVKHEQ